MKRRFIIYRRKLGGTLYIEDTQTRKQEMRAARTGRSTLTFVSISTSVRIAGSAKNDPVLTI